jgi:hypothetical protein
VVAAPRAVPVHYRPWRQRAHYVGRDTAMAAMTRAPVTTRDRQGVTAFRRLGPLLEPRHTAGTARARAGTRPLCNDP